MSSRIWNRLRRARSPALFVLLCHAAAFSYAAEPLTLDEAWQHAEQANPKLRASRAELIAAEGQSRDANALLWNNPEVSVEGRRRAIAEPAGTGTRNEGTVGIAQRFELLGQQSARRFIAGANLDAIRATIAETRREVRVEVEQRFVDVLTLQLRTETETQTLKVIQSASGLMQKRFKAGQDNRLDANLARIEAERAQNQVKALREELIRARAALAALLQLAPTSLPEVTGTLESGALPYTLDDLLGTVPNRPGLRALEHREQAARSQLGLERKSAYPDVTLGLSYGRERGLEGRDSITALTFSVPLPLFRRNATAIGRATSDLTRAQIDREATGRDARAQVLALWKQLQSLQDRIDDIQTSILPTLEENQRLSLRALQVGEIGLPQLLLVSRQLFDGRRDLIDAQNALRLTRVSLEAAAGWPAESEMQEANAAPVQQRNGAAK
ncbi:MAG: TolC family protein [Betaproteobacteria bacterium]